MKCDFCDNEADYPLCQEHVNELVVGEISAVDVLNQIKEILYAPGSDAYVVRAIGALIKKTEEGVAPFPMQSAQILADMRKHAEA